MKTDTKTGNNHPQNSVHGGPSTHQAYNAQQDLEGRPTSLDKHQVRTRLAGHGKSPNFSRRLFFTYGFDASGFHFLHNFAISNLRGGREFEGTIRILSYNHLTVIGNGIRPSLSKFFSLSSSLSIQYWKSFLLILKENEKHLLALLALFLTMGKVRNEKTLFNSFQIGYETLKSMNRGESN